ncbi:hypothetical protein DICA2_E11606 [Diutina catenulata]
MDRNPQSPGRRRTEFSLASPASSSSPNHPDPRPHPSEEGAPAPPAHAPSPRDHSTPDPDRPAHPHPDRPSGDIEIAFPKKTIATRTQSLQSVLSAASLKSLAQATPGTASVHSHQPSRSSTTLHRNPSVVSTSSRGARDVQSFIQAPVLTFASKPDEVEIGQHSPFTDARVTEPSHARSARSSGRSSAKSSARSSAPTSPPPKSSSPTEAGSPQGKASADTATSNRDDAKADKADTNKADTKDTKTASTDAGNTKGNTKASDKANTSANNATSSNATNKTGAASANTSATSATSATSTSSTSSSAAPLQHPSPARRASGGTRPRQLSEEAVQAQNLTLNALKKLSLSPLPMVSPSGRQTKSATVTQASTPYRPAAVDLSSFPQLTRQSASLNHVPSIDCVREDSADSANTSASSHTSASAHTSASSSRAPTAPSSATIAAVLGHQGRPSAPQVAPPSVSPPQPRRDYHAQQAARQRQLQRGALAGVVGGTPGAPGAPGATTAPATPAAPDSRPFHPQHPFESGAQGYFGAKRSASTPTHHPTPTKCKLQQINGLRSPMYVPAVLRVTQNTLAPQHEDGAVPPVRGASSPQSFESSPEPSLKGTPPSTTPLSSSASVKGYDDIMRAPPTRKHWLRDETVDKCMISSCPRVFNFFERRHHCRKCGGIFCKEHTSHLLYINHLAQFTTGGRGTLSKVCDRCIDEYSEFIQAEFGPSSAPAPAHAPASPSRVASLQATRSEMGSAPVRAPPAPESTGNYHYQSARPMINGKNISTKEGAQAAGCGRFDDQLQQRDQLVGSVPANWSWSSF